MISLMGLTFLTSTKAFFWSSLGWTVIVGCFLGPSMWGLRRPSMWGLRIKNLEWFLSYLHDVILCITLRILFCPRRTSDDIWLRQEPSIYRSGLFYGCLPFPLHSAPLAKFWLVAKFLLVLVWWRRRNVPNWWCLLEIGFISIWSELEKISK